MTLLEIQNLSVEFGKGSRRFPAVRDVTFSVEAGETLGVVGESGSGKSTLARAVAGLVRPARGSVSFVGGQMLPRHRRVQMVFQNPYGSLNPRMTIGQTLAEARDRLGGDGSTSRRDSVDQLLDMVHLPRSFSDRYAHELSGGQRQRVALARALAVEPRLLILDEATSALDVSVQAAMLKTLKELQGRLGFSCLFISHDLAVVHDVCTRVQVMYLGRIVERARTEELFAAPAHPYTEVLLDSAVGRKTPGKEALPVTDPPDPASPPPGCSFSPRCPHGPLALGEPRQVCVTQDPAALVHTPHDALCHFPLSRIDSPTLATGE